MSSNSNSDENPFSLSIGDLMASLLLVFVLLLAGALLKVGEDENKIATVASNFSNAKQEIAEDLERNFGDNLKEWGAEIDKQKLSIRFSKKSMFDNDDANLKPEFKNVLKKFYPAYIKLLMKHKDEIAEIRIEGHTSTVGDYFYNMQLSQDRSRNVLNYCSQFVNQEQHEWMVNFVTANGLSYSHPIIENGKQNQDKSRRVEFRILTNSEASMNDILDILKP